MFSKLSLLALLPSLLALPAIQKRATYQRISAGRDGLCLSLQGGAGANHENGIAVVSLPCDQSSTWDISPGSGSVILSGTNFALDAGSSPGNNGGLKIWQSYPGLYQQTWYLTDDKRIAITGGDQCLDEGDNGVQTYKCTPGNTNQIWNTQGTTPNYDPTPITTTVGPAPTPNTPSTGPVTTSARRIYAYGGKDQCVTVQQGYPAIGTNVAISDCFADADPFAYLQQWVFDTDRAGQVRLSGDYSYGPLCLDAGENLANGNGIKIWNCIDNIPQQSWLFSGSGLMDTPVGQCLDITKDSGPSFSKPYGQTKSLQTWQCSLGNPQQFFGI